MSDEVSKEELADEHKVVQEVSDSLGVSDGWWATCARYG